MIVKFLITMLENFVRAVGEVWKNCCWVLCGILGGLAWNQISVNGVRKLSKHEWPKLRVLSLCNNILLIFRWQ